MAQTEADFVEELSRRRRDNPFVPFAITLANGETHVVRDRLHFGVQGSRVILVANGGLSVTIRTGDIVEIQDRKPLTNDQSKLREELISHLERKPFEPFVIHMVDGTKYEIVRQFQAAVGETRGYLVSADEKDHRNFRMRDIRSIDQLALA